MSASLVSIFSMSQRSPYLLFAFLIFVVVCCDPSFAQQQIKIPKVEYSPFGKRIDNNSRSKLQSLRQLQPTSFRSRQYRLDTGDVLGVFVKGVLGRYEDAPVQMPDAKNPEALAGLGYPFVVRSDGTVSVPMIKPVVVLGMSITEAERAIAGAYRTGEGGALIRDARQVLVSLLRKRTVQVSVIQDGQDTTFSRQPPPVTTVTLPVDRANVLNALAAANGPSPFSAKQIQHFVGSGSSRSTSSSQLSDGDVVSVESLEPSVFYTANGRFEIPPGKNLTVRQALAMAGANVNRGGLAGAVGFPEGAASSIFVARGRGRLFSADRQTLVQSGDYIAVEQSARDVFANLAVGILQTPGIFRLAR